MKQFSINDIEILVSTMNRTSLDFLFKMFPNEMWKSISILVINQTEKTPLNSDLKNIKIINSSEKGLSKSRNLALKNAIGNILLISDDDVVFKPDFIENILLGFNALDSDFICFQYEKNEKLATKYPLSKQENISWLRLLSVSSCEIAFKRKSLNSIFFDEYFGINAPFMMGEEAVFLADFKKKKYKIGFFPKVLLSHNHDTTGEKLMLPKIYYNSGAIFYRIFGKKYFFWIFIKLLFDLKQKNTTILKVFELANQAKNGKNDYLKLNDKR